MRKQYGTRRRIRHGGVKRPHSLSPTRRTTKPYRSPRHWSRTIPRLSIPRPAVSPRNPNGSRPGYSRLQSTLRLPPLPQGGMRHISPRSPQSPLPPGPPPPRPKPIAAHGCDPECDACKRYKMKYARWLAASAEWGAQREAYENWQERQQAFSGRTSTRKNSPPKTTVN